MLGSRSWVTSKRFFLKKEKITEKTKLKISISEGERGEVAER